MNITFDDKERELIRYRVAQSAISLMDIIDIARTLDDEELRSTCYYELNIHQSILSKLDELDELEYDYEDDFKEEEWED